MNKSSLNAWAKPLLDALKDIEVAARNFPGDASMLDELERQIKALPVPDYMALALDMAGEMETAAAKDIKIGVSKIIRVAAFAAENPGFSPLTDAIARIEGKTPIISKLKSAEWENVPLAFRERGQFSAGVESIKVMGQIQSKLLNAVSHQREMLDNGKERYVSRDSFLRDIRQAAMDEGLDTGAGNVLTNIASVRRIGLIYDMQNAQAAGYARWRLDNDADALAILPAWRLGKSSAKKPRDEAEWLAKWNEAGNAVNWEGAARKDLVALKTSPIWMKLSRFGTPWPPFDWGSTRELEDVWRDEAERLGLVSPGEKIHPTMERDFNDEIEASVSDWRPEMFKLIKDAFGDQVVEKDGKAQWQGTVIKEMVDRALADTTWNGKAMSLGLPTDRTLAKASSIKDLTGYDLKLDPSHIRKTWRDHGPKDAYEPGSGEWRKGHIPLSKMDYEMVAHVWRDPDDVQPGDKPGDLVFTKRIQGRLVAVTWNVSEGKTALLKSVYKWQ